MLQKGVIYSSNQYFKGALKVQIPLDFFIDIYIFRDEGNRCWRPGGLHVDPPSSQMKE